MKQFTKEWCLAMAAREEGEHVTAGTFSNDKNDNVAFMQLVGLLRKKNKLTLEKFAQKADLDLEEVLQLEGNPQYRPGPRTVYNISKVFKLPSKILMQLSGITSSRDFEMPENILPFAACSSNIDKLTQEEIIALEYFVSIVSKIAR